MSPSGNPAPIASAEAPQWPLTRIARWAGAGIVVLGSALALRYLLIEPHAVAMTCAGDNAPVWCDAREAILMMHGLKVWGWAGLASGALALAFGWRPALWLGFGMSLMGLVLYNADLAAVGLMLTCLRLPRA